MADECSFCTEWCSTVLYSESWKSSSVKKIHYLNGQQDVPIHSFQKRRPSTTEAVGIIHDLDLDRERVCTSQPTCISKDSVFIVDLQQLKHPSDVLFDDMGTWVCNGCRRTWITVDEDGELEFFNKNNPKDRENCYKVVRKYYIHKGRKALADTDVRTKNVVNPPNHLMHLTQVRHHHQHQVCTQLASVLHMPILPVLQCLLLRFQYSIHHL